MRPLPFKIRLEILTLAAIGLGLLVGGPGPTHAANLEYDRVLAPETSDDGTPYEEPEISPDVLHDPGDIDEDDEKLPKNPDGEPLDNGTPWLDPMLHLMRWVVQIRWIV